MRFPRLLANIAGSVAALTVFSACSDTVSPNNEVLRASTSTTANIWGRNNKAPTASISSPSSGASAVQGANVQFSGSGNDPERGSLSGSSLQWRSSRDGSIGTGTSFSKSTLSVGTHTITLTVKDASGATGTASTTVTVNAPVVVNTPPVAQFTVSCLLLVCSADASASTDNAGIVQYAWNLNGQLATTTLPIVSNTFLAAGTFSVTLTVKDAAGLTASLTKSVSVSAGTTTPPPPPPPPSGTPSSANEPTGMTLITNRAFNSVADGDNGWGYKENVTHGMTVVSDGSAPVSAGNVARITYPTGFVGGDGIARTCRTFSATEQKKTIYMSTWIELSSNFQGHPNSFINKIFYVYLNNHSTDIALEAWGGNMDPLAHGIVMQNLAAAYPDSWGGAGGVTVSRTRNVNTTLPFARGQWIHLEYLMVANTPGVADGSIDAWQDGIKIHSHPNIMFTPAGGNSKFEEVCWDPIWGGVAGTVASTFWMQIDNMYVSGK